MRRFAHAQPADQESAAFLDIQENRAGLPAARLHMDCTYTTPIAQLGSSADTRQDSRNSLARQENHLTRGARGFQSELKSGAQRTKPFDKRAATGPSQRLLVPVVTRPNDRLA